MIFDLICLYQQIQTVPTKKLFPGVTVTIITIMIMTMMISIMIITVIMMTVMTIAVITMINIVPGAQLMMMLMLDFTRSCIKLIKVKTMQIWKRWDKYYYYYYYYYYQLILSITITTNIYMELLRIQTRSQLTVWFKISFRQ